jgi:hypothetical protein
MAFNEHREWTEDLTPGDGSDPVVIAAGDIGAENGQMHRTATLVADVPDALVLALGDNAYNDGTTEEFRQHYESTWGRFKDRTWACAGNHDYHSAHISPFPHYHYFGDRAGQFWRSFTSRCLHRARMGTTERRSIFGTRYISETLKSSLTATITTTSASIRRIPSRTS